MRLKRPRLLLASVVVLVLVGTTYVALAGDDDEDITSGPPIGLPPPAVTAAEVQQARAVLSENQVYQQLGGDSLDLVDPQAWMGPGGEKRGIFAKLALPQAAESTGPWRYLECVGTHYVEVTADFVRITALTVVIDLERNELVQFGPDWPETGELRGGRRPEDIPAEQYTALYDILTGEPREDCPLGAEED